MQNVCCQKWRLSANIPSKVFNSFSSNHTPNIADDEFWIFKYYLFFPCCYFKRFPIDITNLYRKSNSKQNQSFYSVFGSLAFFFCFNSLLVFLCNLFLVFWWWQKYYWCHLSRVMMCNRQILNFSRAFYCSFVVFYGIGNTLTNKTNKQKNVMTKQFSFQ